MGLYVSHDCWYASYGKFHHFRTAVGLVVGVPLDLMEGHYDKDEWMVCAGETVSHKNLLEHRLQMLPLSCVARPNSKRTSNSAEFERVQVGRC